MKVLVHWFLDIFQGAADGGQPDNAVLIDTKKKVGYGTTVLGCDHGVFGVVYEITV
jgi:hypothetical protein